VNNITAGVKVRHKVAPLSTLTLTYLWRRGRLSHWHRVPQSHSRTRHCSIIRDTPSLWNKAKFDAS